MVFGRGTRPQPIAAWWGTTWECTYSNFLPLTPPPPMMPRPFSIRSFRKDIRLMQSLNSSLPRAQSVVKKGREGNCGDPGKYPAQWTWTRVYEVSAEDKDWYPANAVLTVHLPLRLRWPAFPLSLSLWPLRIASFFFFFFGSPLGRAVVLCPAFAVVCVALISDSLRDTEAPGSFRSALSVALSGAGWSPHLALDCLFHSWKGEKKS